LPTGPPYYLLKSVCVCFHGPLCIVRACGSAETISDGSLHRFLPSHTEPNQHSPPFPAMPSCVCVEVCVLGGCDSACPSTNQRVRGSSHPCEILILQSCDALIRNRELDQVSEPDAGISDRNLLTPDDANTPPELHPIIPSVFSLTTHFILR